MEFPVSIITVCSLENQYSIVYGCRIQIPPQTSPTEAQRPPPSQKSTSVGQLFIAVTIFSFKCHSRAYLLHLLSRNILNKHVTPLYILAHSLPFNKMFNVYIQRQISLCNNTFADMCLHCCQQRHFKTKQIIYVCIISAVHNLWHLSAIFVQICYF